MVNDCTCVCCLSWIGRRFFFPSTMRKLKRHLALLKCCQSWTKWQAWRWHCDGGTMCGGALLERRRKKYHLTHSRYVSNLLQALGNSLLTVGIALNNCLLVCWFNWTPTWRKESGFPVLKDFVSCHGHWDGILPLCCHGIVMAARCVAARTWKEEEKIPPYSLKIGFYSPPGPRKQLAHCWYCFELLVSCLLVWLDANLKKGKWVFCL